MAIILELFIALVLLGLVIQIIKWAFSLVRQGAALIFGLILAPAIGPGWAAEWALEKIRCRRLAAILATTCTVVAFIAVSTGQNGYIAPFSIESYTYLLPVIMNVALLYQFWLRHKAQSLSEPIDFFSIQDREFFQWFYSAFFAGLIAACTEQVYIWADWPVSWLCWSIAFVLQAVALNQEVVLRKGLLEARVALQPKEKLNASAWLSNFKKDFAIGPEKAEAIYFGVLLHLMKTGRVDELELNGTSWIFNHNWHLNVTNSVSASIAGLLRQPEDEFLNQLSQGFGLSAADSRDYAERHLAFGERYAFIDGNYFVHYANNDRVHRCVSCGIAEENLAEQETGEWHCSLTCKETEKACLTIHQKPMEEFLSEAASMGFIVMAGAETWKINHKVVANPQGHGYAAEQANHRIDLARGKSAKVVGDDFAKNGPDRLVEGELIQTKYCKTAGKSIGQCFTHDTATGHESYKYLKDGKPMAVEVPRDQYDIAIKNMEHRIRQGQVPGVTNPEEAKDLVVKGHLTYAQAQNIVKFGTLESLTYDAVEGAVAGAVAGGIGFTISAFVFYLNTGDSKKALQVAVVQAGKTFGKTLVIHVGTQQLHRVEAVQFVLNRIDANALPTGLADFLQSGFGVESRSQLSRALQGTVVTSVVVIAVTTGPDLLKLVRGRISKEQFAKNVAVAGSGVAGGTAGAVVGGAIGAAAGGPIGMWAGKIIGGMAGGMLAAAFANEVANEYMEDDRVKMLRIIQVQIEFLAKLFILTQTEIENLHKNLESSITAKSLEELQAEKRNRRAKANALVKPIVVRIVKQRPDLSFSMENVLEAFDGVPA